VVVEEDDKDQLDRTKIKRKSSKKLRDKRCLIIKIMEKKIKVIGNLIHHSDFLNNIF